MRHSRYLCTSLAAASVMAAAFASAPASAQRVEVGNAAVVVGEVEMSNAQITDPRPVARRQRLAWGDRIDTGRRSQLQILLVDRSTFGMGARSSLRIDRFVYDPDEGRSMLATLFRGAMRFFSGQQNPANSADIETPSGRIGIRGTAVDMIVGGDAEKWAEDEDFVGGVRSEKDEATLVILRGPGAGTAGGLTPGVADVEAAGVTVVLDQPGLAAYIPRNGAPPIGPFRISDRTLRKVQEELAPEVARAFDGNGLLEALVPAALGAVALGVILTDGGDDNDNSAGQGGQNTNDNGQNDTAGVPNNQID